MSGAYQTQPRGKDSTGSSGPQTKTPPSSPVFNSHLSVTPHSVHQEILLSLQNIFKIQPFLLAPRPPRRPSHSTPPFATGSLKSEVSAHPGFAENSTMDSQFTGGRKASPPQGLQGPHGLPCLLISLRPASLPPGTPAGALPLSPGLSPSLVPSISAQMSLSVPSEETQGTSSIWISNKQCITF